MGVNISSLTTGQVPFLPLPHHPGTWGYALLLVLPLGA